MHIKDKDFIRGEVPMTKQEVRAISIAKLDLKEETILIDIGAGSGSVGIEAATYIPNGKIYGIEINNTGIKVIKKNIEKFKIKNYELIEGLAPTDIPNISVDRMFIGGSKGNLEIILKWFLECSMVDSKVVINTITLESLSEALKALEKLEFLEIEVVNINISRNKKIGRYNMMMGENPIYIISAKRR
ncbi:MAG: precorrin-6Y C5,15-methyltransferase (decarboxylating) subunit CbiT [Psychrilyobacter sp.]|nr:precorrin-6Y C5,15-methyltransferase (decarboxylating) subunit CbiT [Psychrilyobacter sp.]